MRRDVIVFDIETVPDAEAARRLLGLGELDDVAARDALSDYFLEKTEGRNDFPRQPFHQVAAISYAQLVFEPGEEGGAELVIRRLGTGGDAGSGESELLEGFFGMIDKRAPRLVSFNGRGFDVPVLKYRAMVHGLSCPRWFSEGDRWNSYDSRYSKDYHVDLLEVLSDFGASARCSMHEVASAFGVPGKLDTAGDDVRGMFETGQIEAIRNYCETDVCTTLLIFLRWQRFTGALSEGAYARSILGLRHYLESEIEARPHLGEVLNAWGEGAAS
ncbi:MAG: 3'-5' exonuclease [Mariprofundaceae bacterium]|nr:3'-5' exonuclease [Mariprofundaceae bacterium]